VLSAWNGLMMSPSERLGRKQKKKYPLLLQLTMLPPLPLHSLHLRPLQTRLLSLKTLQNPQSSRLLYGSISRDTWGRLIRKERIQDCRPAYLPNRTS
jgi:hypothetical protein